jgi:hypothetical protein
MGQEAPVSKYFGFYDKKAFITKISDADHTDASPAINDINNFAPIYLLGFSINQSNEIATYMDAEKILNWFEANPEKARKSPNHLKDFSRLKFDENQVIVIAKLKQ